MDAGTSTPRPGPAMGATGDTPPAAEGDQDRSPRARLRASLVWAGIATLALLSLLALVHLWVDIEAVLSIRGGAVAIAGRFAPVLILGGTALVATLAVGYLAAAGRRGEVVAIAIGLLVLIGLRLFVAATFDGVVRGEPAAYDERAAGVLGGDWGFGDRPMGYIVSLAGAYALIDDRQVAVEALNLVFAVAAGGSVWALGRSLYGSRTGALALLGYALWPAGALMISVRMPQTAYDLAIVVAALAATNTVAGWRGSALVGALLGVGQWLRPSTPALMAAFLLARAWPGGPWRRLVGATVMPMVFAFLLVLAPVIWHNSQEHDELSITTSRFGGQVLYIGTNEPSGGTWDRDAMDALIAISGPELEGIGEVGGRIAIGRIRDDPAGIALLAVRKQDTLWGTEHFGVEYGIARSLADRTAHPRAAAAILLSQSFYVLLLMLSATGVYLLRERPDRLVALAIVTIWSIAAIHALLEVRDRHHSYLIPLLLPLAAVTLAHLFAQIERLMGRTSSD